MFAFHFGFCSFVVVFLLILQSLLIFFVTELRRVWSFWLAGFDFAFWRAGAIRLGWNLIRRVKAVIGNDRKMISELVCIGIKVGHCVLHIHASM